MSETRDIDLRLYEDSVAGVCKARPNTDPDQAGYYYASEDVVRLVKSLRAQLAAAERERDELREALEGLHDEQNGPPLERRAARWQAAMTKAEELLGIKQGA